MCNLKHYASSSYIKHDYSKSSMVGKFSRQHNKDQENITFFRMRIERTTVASTGRRQAVASRRPLQLFSLYIVKYTFFLFPFTADPLRNVKRVETLSISRRINSNRLCQIESENVRKKIHGEVRTCLQETPRGD